MALGRRALHGLVWMLAQNVVSRACSLLSQLVLAALLRPADFGLIGLTYTVSSITTTLLNIGIDDVLMQRSKALRLWAGPAFWISFGLALAAALLMVGASPLAATIYQAPGMVGLLAILALSMPIGALATVPSVVLRARMQFGTVAVYGALEIVAQATLTVVLAWYGFGAYSFVIPAPLLAAAKSVAFWRLASLDASYRPKRRRWKYLVGNTAANFMSRLLLTIMGQGDYMMLGLVASQAVVGSYYFGFRLAAQPLWVLAGNIAGVLFPALVQLKAEPRRQGDAALKASALLSFCVMPLALMQAAVAAPVVDSLFGDKWASAIPVIQLLSFGLALDAVSWIAGALLSARGEFKAGLAYMLCLAPIFFVLIGIGAWLDKAVGVAWALCVYYAATQPVFVYVVYRRCGVTIGQVAAIYLKPIVCGAAGIGLGFAVSLLPAVASIPLLRAIIICAVGGVIYAGLVRLLAPEIWHEVKDRVSRAVRRQAPA